MYYRTTRGSNASIVPFWGDEGELTYPESKLRDIDAYLKNPVLLKTDPTSYQLLRIRRPSPKDAKSKPVKPKKLKIKRFSKREAKFDQALAADEEDEQPDSAPPVDVLTEGEQLNQVNPENDDDTSDEDEEDDELEQNDDDNSRHLPIPGDAWEIRGLVPIQRHWRMEDKDR